MSTFHQATCTAPVNIAVIKYWGKRDVALNLPTNSSLSVTLDQDDLKSTTTIRADSTFDKDRLWLNGTEDDIKPGGRLAKAIEGVRELRRKEEEAQNVGGGDQKPLSSLPIHIVSHNNFPTAAGLASSASGFAALVYTLGTLYGLTSSSSSPSSSSPSSSLSTLSSIARLGSGSACRSLFGGYVAWRVGTFPSGTDSLAVQVAPRSHWPSMHAVICVVSDAKKGVASTAGMQATVSTSPLIQHRISNVVEGRMSQIETAIKEKDFDTFAKVTMRDSNQFHAVCLDTEPPIFYLNDVSRAIIKIVEELNRASIKGGKGYVAAYTYDAGPNAVIYTLDKDVKTVIGLVTRYFEGVEYQKEKKGLWKAEENPEESALPEGFEEKIVPRFPKGSVKSIIHTKVGEGPRVLEEEDGLIGEDGMPKEVKA